MPSRVTDVPSPEQPPVQPPDRPIVLCGLPGAGKTSIGRALASRLGRRFVDLDEAIVATSGMSIEEWFTDKGQYAFRDYEAEQLANNLQPGIVLSLGGGALGNATSRARLRESARLIWLRAPIATLAARLAPNAERSARPLLASGDLTAHLTQLAADREPLYRGADLVLDTDGKTIDALAASLAARIAAPRLAVTLSDHRYPIVFAPDAESFVEELALAAPSHRYCIITDSTVASLHGHRYRRAIAGSDLFTVHPGEDSKRWAVAGELLEQLARAGLDRQSVIVALGGGVVGDLAGFVAATYMRGIRLVQVPTTVLAQVDSSVGGKTGVNLDAGKNLAGAFCQPHLVFVDRSTLATLPQRDVAAGLAELVKHALLVEDDRLLAQLEAAADDLRQGQLDALPPLLRDSCAWKARVVAADPLERSDAPDGGRAQLNLGHTIGHMLEAESLREPSPLRHGEAVALGLVAVLDLGVRLGRTPAALADRVRALLARLGLDVDYAARLRASPAAQDPHERIRYLLRDKKNRHDRGDARVRFVLLEAIGAPRMAELPLETVQQTVFALE